MLVVTISSTPCLLTRGLVRPQAVPLSQLIDLVNERFGTDFNQADQLFFDQIIEAAMTDLRSCGRQPQSIRAISSSWYSGICWRSFSSSAWTRMRIYSFVL